MQIRQFGLLAVSLALVAPFMPMSNAMVPPVGCTVGPGDSVCVFPCPLQWSTIEVVAYGGDAGATIEGTCGTGGADCEADPNEFCGDFGATAGLSGRCELHDTGDPPDKTAFGSCFVSGFGPREGVNNCPHPPNHSHTYGSGGSAGARSSTATSGEEVGAGVVTVSETNTVDCDGNGEPGDYDGDWETGVGGGFFGFGPWADEPICGYGLTEHGGTVAVNDIVLFGTNVWFVIGADQTAGPTIQVDPVSGETTCTTDGNIEECDPAAPSPTCGPSDCLTEPQNLGHPDGPVGDGVTCGAGGDGGYWVFLSGFFVDEESATDVHVGNPPIAGTITA